MAKPKIILVGAVELSRVTLERLLAQQLVPDLIITIPADKSAMHSDYVDMAELGRRHGILVLHTLNVSNAEVMAAARAIDPDYIFVIGWSRLCGPDFMALARKGVLGHHPAPLPKMRGRAALAWTILLGLEQTGSTLFWMDEGTDSGDIAAQHMFALDRQETLPMLLDRHLHALSDMLDEVLPQLAAGAMPSTPQNHEQASYLAVRRPEDGLIDWAQPQAEIDRLIRAVTRPYPGAFTWLNGRRVTIYAAEPVHFANWHAQTGQVFTFDDGVPVVRCGDGRDLRLSDYSFDDDPAERLKGQPRFG